MAQTFVNLEQAWLRDLIKRVRGKVPACLQLKTCRYGKYMAKAFKTSRVPTKPQNSELVMFSWQNLGNPFDSSSNTSNTLSHFEFGGAVVMVVTLMYPFPKPSCK